MECIKGRLTNPAWYKEAGHDLVVAKQLIDSLTPEQQMNVSAKVLSAYKKLYKGVNKWHRSARKKERRRTEANKSRTT